MLGGVFLCVTGAEALYADMGHFGKGPIRLAWYCVVFPSLILNYAGQAAIVVDGAPTEGNIFYDLCPAPLLTPLIVLATVATVIASQSIITGAFSMTRQAILLGWLPRLRIKQTSDEGYGQIYVGAVNWLLMIVTLGLTIGFGKSDNLAAAYGIAVSLTMLMTSVLLFIAMREIWGWPLLGAGAVAAAFMIVDGAFFAANMAKVLEGGWVPLALACAVYFVMWIWHRGVKAVNDAVVAEQVPLADFVKRLQVGDIARVPGSAVFLTRAKNETPPVMSWHVKQNRSLHENVLALTLTVVSTPRVDNAEAHHADAGRRKFLARRGEDGLHGNSQHRAHSDAMPGQARAHQPRRCHLLRRPRDDRAARGRQRSAAVGDRAVRRDGPQRGAHQRLAPPPARPRRRDRPRDRDLAALAG